MVTSEIEARVAALERDAAAKDVRIEVLDREAKAARERAHVTADLIQGALGAVANLREVPSQITALSVDLAAIKGRIAGAAAIAIVAVPVITVVVTKLIK